VIVLLAPWLIRNLGSRDEILDFSQDWLSAMNFWRGLPIYLDHDHSVPRHLGPGVHSILKVNAHPPTSVLATLPFASLPYHQAFVVFNVLSVLALVVTLVLIGRELRWPWRFWYTVPALAAGMLYAFLGELRGQIEQGQWDLVLLLLLVGSWSAWRRQWPALAGVLLGLATTLKLFPGLLLLPLLFWRQWRAAAWWVATVALVTLLTAGVLGLECYRDYVSEVLPQLDSFRSSRNAVSLRNFWARLFDPASPRLTPLLVSPLLARFLTLASAGLVLAGLIRIWLGARNQGQRDQGYCLTVVAMLLLSPLAWDHYLVLLVLPLACFWHTFPQDRPTRWALTLLTLLLLLNPNCYWFVLLHDADLGWLLFHVRTWLTPYAIPLVPWQLLTAISLPTYGLVSLFVLGLLVARRWAANPADRAVPLPA